MRSALLFLVFLGLLPSALAMPHVGVLLWGWLGYMNPHRLTWGALNSLPYVLIVAATTLLAWFLSREPKRIPMGATTILLLLFSVWMTLTTVTAFNQALGWYYWDRNIKTMVFTFAVMGLMTNRVRLHALIWVIVLSLGYFGAAGGMFVFLTGGAHRVFGPPSSMIADNNHLALALTMTLPLMYYLRTLSESRYTRHALTGLMMLTVFGIVGSYSRGGFIALGTLCLYALVRMNRRFLTAVVALPVLYMAFHFMPEQWHERMGTIETAEEDSSFQSRLTAWEFNYTLATAFPVTGAGFGGTYTSELWKRFAPGERVRAAHSIYFEVLGEHGFIGLTLFLLIAFFTWSNVRYVVRNTRDRPELFWAHTLARAIELSLVSYLVAGAALSMAYYDVYYSLIAVSVVLRHVVKTATAPAAAQQRPAISGRQGALRLPPAAARQPGASILP